MADVNMFTTPFQLTKSMHRNVHPAIDPINPALSAKGKIIIITGADGGLGAVSPQISRQQSGSTRAHSTLKGYRKSVSLGWCYWYRPCWAYG